MWFSLGSALHTVQDYWSHWVPQYTLAKHVRYYTNLYYKYDLRLRFLYDSDLINYDDNKDTMTNFNNAVDNSYTIIDKFLRYVSGEELKDSLKDYWVGVR
jgi:hypothetical protein